MILDIMIITSPVFLVLGGFFAWERFHVYRERRFFRREREAREKIEAAFLKQNKARLVPSHKVGCQLASRADWPVCPRCGLKQPAGIS